MKLIIDIPEMAYGAYKEWHKNKVATVEQSLIANGIPYEERPQSDLISRDTLKKKLQARHDNGEEDFDKGYNIGIETAIELLDNAPAVEVNVQDLINEYNKGFNNGYKSGKNARPQGELSEKLKDRIEESVCKHCQMNKHCELCEISRVFQIIALTAKEQEGGAE